MNELVRNFFHSHNSEFEETPPNFLDPTITFKLKGAKHNYCDVFDNELLIIDVEGTTYLSRTSDHDEARKLLEEKYSHTKRYKIA